MICGSAIRPRVHAIAVCDARECRRTSLGALPAREQRRFEASLRAVVQQHADCMPRGAGLRLDDAAVASVALLPANNRALTPLPSAAREAFRTGLQSRLASYPEASIDASVPFDDAAALEGGRDDHSAMMFRGCAACRGHCCTRGGTHAFLSADGLRAIAARETGGDTGAALHALYAQHLPAMHYEHSCVFHGETGCSLPRSLRSDTCNRYLCGGLAVLRRELVASGAGDAVVGAATWSGLERIAVLDARGVTDVPISPVAAVAPRF